MQRGDSRRSRSRSPTRVNGRPSPSASDAPLTKAQQSAIAELEERLNLAFGDGDEPPRPQRAAGVVPSRMVPLASNGASSQRGDGPRERHADASGGTTPATRQTQAPPSRLDWGSSRRDSDSAASSSAPRPASQLQQPQRRDVNREPPHINREPLPSAWGGAQRAIERNFAATQPLDFRQGPQGPQRGDAARRSPRRS